MQILVEEAQVNDWVDHKLAWTVVCHLTACEAYEA